MQNAIEIDSYGMRMTGSGAVSFGYSGFCANQHYGGMSTHSHAHTRTHTHTHTHTYTHTHMYTHTHTCTSARTRKSS